MSNEITIDQGNTMPAAAPLPPANSMLQVIERAALNPEVDIDKMERLLSMKERLDADEARKEFSSAMSFAQAEMEPIARDRQNKGTGSNYSTYEAICKAIKPVITRHGFAMSFGTDDSPLEHHYRITCELTHTSGHSKTYKVDMPIDDKTPSGKKTKTDIQSSGSTLTYGRRYLTMLVWDLATEDDDGEANRKKAEQQAGISAVQAAQLRELIEQSGTEVEKFLAYAKAPSVEEIPSSAYPRLEAMLKTKIEG